jgi:predicted phosphoribosyltransferase
MAPRFRDRTDAGKVLANLLMRYKDRPDNLVLALPRGGVPVGYEVAKAINAPLDVVTVRKLGLPGQEELAIGAIAPGGVRVLNSAIIREAGVPRETIEAMTVAEQQRLERRERAYRDDRPPPPIEGHHVILVDDGIATGYTMRAAIHAVKRRSPASITVAVPVASPVACDEFRGEVDDIVCVETPEPFYAVGAWYDDFSQTTDDEVRDLLDCATGHGPARPRQS